MKELDVLMWEQAFNAVNSYHVYDSIGRYVGTYSWEEAQKLIEQNEDWTCSEVLA